MTTPITSTKNVNGSTDGETAEREVLEFWTPERRRGARVVEASFDVASLPRKVSRPPFESPSQDAIPVMHPHSHPTSGGVKRVALDSFSTRRADVNRFPAACVGKLWVRFGSETRTGTAWVVGQSAIFTAGHLIYDRSLGWASSALFEARYDDGHFLGAWSAKTLVVRAEWVNGGGYLDDFGGFTTWNPVAPATGSLGYMTNIPINQGSWLLYGYPQDPVDGYPFDGLHMWETNGAFIYEKTWLITAGCNMTAGAHGGPWVLLRDGGWYANGMSVSRTDDPGAMSPYFGNEFLSVIDTLKEAGGF